jgi:hypothetical protein
VAGEMCHEVGEVVEKADGRAKDYLQEEETLRL